MALKTFEIEERIGIPPGGGMLTLPDVSNVEDNLLREWLRSMAIPRWKVDATNRYWIQQIYIRGYKYALGVKRKAEEEEALKKGTHPMPRVTKMPFNIVDDDDLTTNNPPNIPDSPEHNFISAMARGDIIAATRELKVHRGLSLKESHDIVQDLAKGRLLPGFDHRVYDAWTGATRPSPTSIDATKLNGDAAAAISQLYVKVDRISSTIVDLQRSLNESSRELSAARAAATKSAEAAVTAADEAARKAVSFVLDAIQQRATATSVSESESPTSEPELPLDIPPPPLIDPHFHFDPGASRALLAAMNLKKNILITGQTGCGKTQLILQMHAKLGRPIARVNANGDMSVASFIGSWVSVDEFRLGILPLAMKGGYPILIDEADYIPPHIAAVLNPAAEKGGSLFIPETGERIKARNGFFIAATANTGGRGDGTGRYTGTEVLNLAFLDRFGITVKMDYMLQGSEIDLLQKYCPSAGLSLCTGLVSLATQVRRAFAARELGGTLSTRKLVDIMDLMQSGFDFTEALSLSFLNTLDEDDEKFVTSIADRLFDGNEPR